MKIKFVSGRNERTVKVYSAREFQISNVIHGFGVDGVEVVDFRSTRLAEWDEEKGKWQLLLTGKTADEVVIGED